MDVKGLDIFSEEAEEILFVKLEAWETVLEVVEEEVDFVEDAGADDVGLRKAADDKDEDTERLSR